MNKKNKTYSGRISIVGRTNVGKSTLLNAIIGEKISIVTHKPQTTRQNILGIKHQQHHEMIFIDTPGVHKNRGQKQINRLMNRNAIGALHGVDVIAMVIPINHFTSEDQDLIDQFSQEEVPKIAVINKLDLVKSNTKALPFLAQINALGVFDEIVSVSALYQRDISLLEQYLCDYLPQRDWHFSKDQATDLPTHTRISEAIREAVFKLVRAEVPYSVSVTIEKTQTVRKCEHIYANILVESPGQKKILIGRNGEMIKKIGILARKDIEKIVASKVFLKLFVKTEAGWSKDDQHLGQQV